MPNPADYLHFLRAKGSFDKSSGFSVSDSDIKPKLKPHQRAIVRWAVRKGCGYASRCGRVTEQEQQR